jgi:hypothetical protein
MPKYILSQLVKQRLNEISICLYCGSTENLTVDHIIPRSKGGKNILDNVTKACDFCNLFKSSHDITQFYEKVINYRFTSYYMFHQSLKLHRKADHDCYLEDLLRYRIEHSYYTRIIYSIEHKNYYIEQPSVAD